MGNNFDDDGVDDGFDSTQTQVTDITEILAAQDKGAPNSDDGGPGAGGTGEEDAVDILEDDMEDGEDVSSEHTSVDISLEDMYRQQAQAAAAQSATDDGQTAGDDDDEEDDDEEDSTSATAAIDLGSLKPLPSPVGSSGAAMPGASMPSGQLDDAEVNADLEALGPAFPGAEEHSRVESHTGVSGWSESAIDIDEMDDVGNTPVEHEMELTDPAPEESDHWGEYDDGATGGSWERTAAVPAEALGSQSAKAPAQMEPEYSARNTNVTGLKSPVREEAAARLVCLQGGDEGREFPIAQGETSVGRDPQNAIVLGEPSASRQHATFLFDGQAFTLLDQRSGNGTFVNGQKIDRARVRSGDEIGFGRGVYRFLEVGDVFKPVDAAGAPVLPGSAPADWTQIIGKKPWLVAAAATTLVLFIVGLALMLRGGDDGAQEQTLYRHYRSGVADFLRKDWGKAENSFNFMLQLDPQNVRGRAYIQAVLEERQSERRLAAANEAKNQGQWTQAYALANKVGGVLLRTDAQALMATIEPHLDAMVSKARAALDGGQPQEALDALVAIEAVRGERADIASLKAWALRAGAKEKGGQPETAPKAEDKAPAKAEEAAPEPPQEAAPAEPAPEPERAQPEEAPQEREASARSQSRQRSSGRGNAAVLREVRDMVGNGKFKGAVAALEKEQGKAASEMLARVRKLDDVYLKARDEHRSKNTAKALKLLKQAQGLERRITGGKTPLAEEIGRKIADMHYVAGIEKYYAGNLGEAYRAFRQALNSYGEHKPAKGGLKNVLADVEELYQEGYVAAGNGDNATAKDRFEKVMKILPASENYHKKAKKRLATLR